MEGTFVLSILSILMLGSIVLGLGVFRYQQVAALAREAARYASVRGSDYRRASGSTALTGSGIYNSAIKPRAQGLNLARLSYSVSWSDASQSPTYVLNAAANTFRQNYVTVTVSYSWLPEAVLGGKSVTFTSLAVLPVKY